MTNKVTKKPSIADIAKAYKAEESANVETVSKKVESSIELVEQIVRLMKDKKATNIVAVKVDHLTVVADYFVIASGNSTTQVRAIADNIDIELEKVEVDVIRSEGLSGGNWVALDFGNVIVHIFEESVRANYQLERLWTDGKNVTEY